MPDMDAPPDPQRADRAVFDADDDPAQTAAALRARREAARNEILKEDDGNAGQFAPESEAPAPRDAATMVLYRMERGAPRILMGCRSGGHDFMPNKYVFPGGRVEDGDAAAPSVSELGAREEEALRHQAVLAPRAYGLTAIRETFEETGLLIGRDARLTSPPPEGWEEFYAQGVMPCLSSFSFVGRAITPPMRHKRFDARFFMANASDCLIDDRDTVDGRELADLRWFTLEDIGQLDLPTVTRYVISEVEQRLVQPGSLKPFFLRWVQGGSVQERIGEDG
jgi:8-oxo-dGTP pyrophosphatase MutT (NUDIX family)